MAKFREKIRARELRRQGKSIKDIATMLGISKSSASLWCSDIKLAQQQIAELHQRMVSGGYMGRLLGARLQKEKRLKRIEFHRNSAVKEIGNLSERDLLMVGLGLHLGEGTKKRNQFYFTNSSPEILGSIIKWLELFGISRKNIFCNVFINNIHKDRVGSVVHAWSKILGIPKNQFNKTVLIKSENKKVYENADSHLGTLALRVAKSSELQYRVLGLSERLLYKIKTI